MKRGEWCGVFVAVGVLAAVAGCTSSTAGRGTPEQPGATAPGQQPGATSGPAGTPSATATATPSASSPAAADGANVAACADGRCEVSVRGGTAIPVPATMRVRDVRVTAVSGDRVTVTGHDTGNSGGGLCSGQCDSSSTNGAFTIRLGTDSRATENGLSITVESIADGAAVLRIEPAG